MDFLLMIKYTFLDYFQDNIHIAIAFAGVVGLVFFRKPKLFFTVFSIALILTGVLYLISTLTITGAYEEHKYINKEKRHYGDYISLDDHKCSAYSLMQSC
jgi:hypothetical protein